MQRRKKAEEGNKKDSRPKKQRKDTKEDRKKDIDKEDSGSENASGCVISTQSDSSSTTNGVFTKYEDYVQSSDTGNLSVDTNTQDQYIENLVKPKRIRNAKDKKSGKISIYRQATNDQTSSYDSQVKNESSLELDLHQYASQGVEIDHIIDVSESSKTIDEINSDTDISLNRNKPIKKQRKRKTCDEGNISHKKSSPDKKYNKLGDKCIKKQSIMRKGFKVCDAPYIESVHKTQHMLASPQTKAEYFREYRRRQSEIFFELVNIECKRLDAIVDFERTCALTDLLNISEFEALKLGINISPEALYRDYKILEQAVKKKRGRPPTVSPDPASSEYDPQGVRIDVENGVVEIDDSCYQVYCNGDKEIFICVLCSKRFPSKSRAKRHYITHTKVKPYKCSNPECNKAFSRRDNMLQHERMHCISRKKNTDEQ